MNRGGVPSRRHCAPRPPGSLSTHHLQTTIHKTGPATNERTGLSGLATCCLPTVGQVPGTWTAWVRTPAPRRSVHRPLSECIAPLIIRSGPARLEARTFRTLIPITGRGGPAQPLVTIVLAEGLTTQSIVSLTLATVLHITPLRETLKLCTVTREHIPFNTIQVFPVPIGGCPARGYSRGRLFHSTLSYVQLQRAVSLQLISQD